MNWRRGCLAAVGGTLALGTALFLVSERTRRLVEHLDGDSVIVLRDRARPENLTIPGVPRLSADLYPAAPGTPGRRPLLVLVHGSAPEGRRHPLCRTLAEQLSAEGFPVLALDLRGFGSSDPPKAPLSENLRFEEDVRAAAVYAIDRGLAQQGGIVYVGHSLGAAVVLRASRLDPPPAAVVALSIPASREIFGEQVDGSWRRFATERLEDMHWPADDASIAAMERYLLELDPEAQRVEGLPAPTLLVFGATERGATNPPRWDPPHEVLLIPGAGHDYTVERGPLSLRFYEREPMRAVVSAIERWAGTWAGGEGAGSRSRSTSSGGSRNLAGMIEVPTPAVM